MSDLMKAVEECKLSKGWDGMPYKLHQNIDLLFAECSKSATKIKQLQKENESLRFEIANSTRNTCLVCDKYIPECRCVANDQ